MVQGKTPKSPVNAEFAKAAAASFRVHGQPGDPSSLQETIAKLPISTPPIALAPQAKIGNALAQIIRDPGAGYPAVIVFAEEALTDDLYPLAKYLLSKDVKFVPQPSSRRVISILPNQQLRLDANGKTQWGRSAIQVQRSNASAAELHRRAAGAKMVTLSGVGRVKLVFDPQAQ